MKNKKEKINLRKFLFILPLLLLALITTVVATFAWWNTLTVEEDVEGTIGDSVILELTAADFEGVLVPKDVFDESILIPGWVKEWSTELNFKVDGRDTAGVSFVLTITSVKIFVGEVDQSSYFDGKIFVDGDEEEDSYFEWRISDGVGGGLSYDIVDNETLDLKLSFRDILPEEQDAVRTTFAGKQLTVTIKAKITAQP